MHVRLQAAVGGAFLFAVLAIALFVPSGTIDYWQAWVGLGVFGSTSTAITIYLARRDPALLARRVRGGPTSEARALQQGVQAVTSLAFIALFVIAGLDHRATWSRVPVAIVAVGDALVALGMAAVFFVFRANTFASSTVEIQPGQSVISTGPYAIVRHPMYASALVLLGGFPLALGSWWAELANVPLVAALVARLLDEERVLATRLPGYAEYRERVRFRLVPHVW
ncbi:MAG TPA: isoprenylcysteine carboxylmethyltransferase family protein [Kofleriaceae bacterium]|nr:isoprenylcysteine carboxylmethyltransferase family protein [Kofleriaceae bacterium]